MKPVSFRGWWRSLYLRVPLRALGIHSKFFLGSIGNCRGLGIFFGGSVGYRRGFRDLGVLFAAAGRQHRPPCSIACAFEVSGRVRFRD